MQTVENNFQEMVEATREYISSQKGFEFLWKEKLEESFRAFLHTGTDPRSVKHVIINADEEEEEHREKARHDEAGSEALSTRERTEDHVSAAQAESERARERGESGLRFRLGRRERTAPKPAERDESVR